MNPNQNEDSAPETVAEPERETPDEIVAPAKVVTASAEAVEVHDVEALGVILPTSNAALPIATPIAAAVAARSQSAEPRMSDADVEQRMRQMSRRSFLSGALAIGAAYGGWHWLASRRGDEGIQWPLRRVLDSNAQFAQDYFSRARLAPTFPLVKISEERTNGDIGLGDDFDAASWQLSVSGLASGEPLALSLNDIKKLPRVDMTTEMKCIEGWSIIVHWTGARFMDFAAKYPPATQSGEAPNVKNKPDNLLPYVSLMTPDRSYYVGMDLPSALHPQTLLCYAMNGKPLTPEHGAPLRLVTPVKYGVKHIKRIGSIEYATNRPADYWAEQGYDWYAGH